MDEPASSISVLIKKRLPSRANRWVGGQLDWFTLTIDSMLQNGEHASLACGENLSVAPRGIPVGFGEICRVTCALVVPPSGLTRIPRASTLIVPRTESSNLGATLLQEESDR